VDWFGTAVETLKSGHRLGLEVSRAVDRRQIDAMLLQPRQKCRLCRIGVGSRVALELIGRR